MEADDGKLISEWERLSFLFQRLPPRPGHCVAVDSEWLIYISLCGASRAGRFVHLMDIGPVPSIDSVDAEGLRVANRSYIIRRYNDLVESLQQHSDEY